MKLASFDTIVAALNAAEVRYLVVGGLAVNAHGYLRFTRDVDIVIRLTTPDIVGAFRALAGIGYRPSVPVTAEQFADPAQREAWRRDKNMLVLKMWSAAHQETPLDIFVYEPFDFDTEYARPRRHGSRRSAGPVCCDSGAHRHEAGGRTFHRPHRH